MNEIKLEIPRLFHHVWLGDQPLPADYARWKEQWLEMNPGWEMKSWTDKNLPRIVNRKEYDAANRLAAKSDILRYELCASFGGVYIDADFEPLRPIEPILANVTSFQADELDDRPCNALIGCVPNDPFYGVVVEKLPESIQDGGDIVETTGPAFLKRMIKHYLGDGYRKRSDSVPGVENRRWRLESADGARRLHGFHWSVFYPYHYDQPELETKEFPNAFAKHHWAASWWKNGGR